MRLTGTSAYGIRLPIISKGDNLVQIVADSVVKACETDSIALNDNDVIGITEAVVAKAQGNFAQTADIAADIKEKFPSGVAGLVFPIMSRNRFFNVLKGISQGLNKTYVLLQCPSDEVGNPIMDLEMIDDIADELSNGPIPAERFIEITNNYKHPFTGVNYIDLYKSANPNIEILVSSDPRDILKFTKDVLVCEIHTRMRTKNRLIKAGAQTVYTLSDILSKPIGDSGYNPDYGVLGSNISTETELKLFPRDCGAFVESVRNELLSRTGKQLEVLVYGDGAFKDPFCGIWELADPVVSPAYTRRLGGRPNEIKIKYVAENVFSGLTGEEKTNAVAKLIREKDQSKTSYSEGTTPRKYADLLGSLCDLVTGSGDKGTPVVIVKGYFDNYATE